MAEKPKVLVVCGPTATGKSTLALALARALSGEIISADSMQIYEGLSVGTAALTPQQAAGVPVHLSGFLPPETRYSVAQWVAAAREYIDNMTKRGVLPVVCGGTGLYISSLVNGIDFTRQADDAGLRRTLEEAWSADGGEAVYGRLARLDPDRAASLRPGDKKRIIRALEQALATGLTAAEREAASRPDAPPYDALLLGLDYPERAALYAATNRRVDAMLADGLLAEARQVWKNRHRYHTAVQAIGYKEFFPFFEETQPLAPCVEKLKQATRNYAKRQRTWFGRMEGIHWLDAGGDSRDTALALARRFTGAA